VLDNLNENAVASNPYANEVPADSTASLLDFGRSVGDDTSSLVSWQRDALVADPFSAMVRDANPQAPGSPNWTDGTVKWQSDPYLAGLPPTPARVAVGPEAFGVGMPPQRPVMPPVQHAPMVQMMFQAQPVQPVQPAQPAHQIVPGFLTHATPLQTPPFGQHIASQQVMSQQVVPQQSMQMTSQFLPQQVVPPQFMQMSMVGSTALLLDPGNAGATIPTPFALARGVDAPAIAPLPRALPFVAARARRTEIDPLIVAYHKGKKRQRRNAAVGRVLMYLMFIALAAGSYAGYLWYQR
jgi:hypothetical protein